MQIIFTQPTNVQFNSSPLSSTFAREAGAETFLHNVLIYSGAVMNLQRH